MILIFTFVLSTLANTSLTTNRFADYDRYETASQIAKSGWSQSDYEILTYGENFPDALASAHLGGTCKRTDSCRLYW
ncbi:cell wall-binding repeat-containing protein [Desulfosporosinus burensis]